MIKNYALILLLSLSLISNSQEVLTFSAYDASSGPVSITANSATVNDELTIVLEDTDIINNFYTDGRSFLYIYGGLDTDDGGYQDAPADFFDNSVQPIVDIVNSDTDLNAGPNTYSITINLAEFYDGVTDGTMVYGYNLIFRNEFSSNDGNTNNQTVDLYIDLVDALKDSSTLGTEELSRDEVQLRLVNKQVLITGSTTIDEVVVYNLLGQQVHAMRSNNSRELQINLAAEPSGVYLLKLRSGSEIINKKILLK